MCKKDKRCQCDTGWNGKFKEGDYYIHRTLGHVYKYLGPYRDDCRKGKFSKGYGQYGPTSTVLYCNMDFYRCDNKELPFKMEVGKLYQYKSNGKIYRCVTIDDYDDTVVIKRWYHENHPNVHNNNYCNAIHPDNLSYWEEYTPPVIEKYYTCVWNQEGQQGYKDVDHAEFSLDIESEDNLELTFTNGKLTGAKVLT